MTDLVTSHAILRWLERIQRVRLDEIDAIAGPLAPDCRRAAAGCRLLGLTVAEAGEIICPPRLALAVRLGAVRIQRETFTLACRDHTVMTVLPGRGTVSPGHTQAAARFRGVLKRTERRVRHDMRALADGAEA